MMSSHVLNDAPSEKVGLAYIAVSDSLNLEDIAALCNFVVTSKQTLEKSENLGRLSLAVVRHRQE